MNGKFTIKMDVGNNIDFHVVGSNFQGNQYKQMFEKDLGKFCDLLYQDVSRSTVESVFNHLTDKIPWKTCPFPKGQHDIINFLLEGSLLPPYIPGNEKWKVELQYLLNGETIGGFNIYALLRSTQSLLNGR